MAKPVLSEESSIAWVIAGQLPNGKWTVRSWGAEMTRREAWAGITGGNCAGAEHARQNKRQKQRQGYKAIKVRFVPV